MFNLQFILHLLVLLYIVVLTHMSNVCPSYGNVGFENRNSCFDRCLPDNDQCEGNKKCCFFLTHPCGHRCIVPKDNREKFGRCPSKTSNQINILWSLCDIHLCDVDYDCPANEKCCKNNCNTQMCLMPIEE